MYRPAWHSTDLGGGSWFMEREEIPQENRNILQMHLIKLLALKFSTVQQIYP